jgi:hypothetical protein
VLRPVFVTRSCTAIEPVPIPGDMDTSALDHTPFVVTGFDEWDVPGVPEQSALANSVMARSAPVALLAAGMRTTPTR